MDMKHPITQPLIALRLYVALSLFISYIIMGTVPQAIVYKVMIESTYGGSYFVLVAFTLALIAVADTVVNDMLPDRYVLIHTKRWRHMGFMSLAIMSAAQAFFILESIGPTVLVFRYVLDAVAATSVAFLGLKELMPFPYHDRRHNIT